MKPAHHPGEHHDDAQQEARQPGRLGPPHPGHAPPLFEGLDTPAPEG